MDGRTFGLYLGISACLVLLGTAVKKLKDGDLESAISDISISAGSFLSLGTIATKGVIDCLSSDYVRPASEPKIY